jgi:hypothetical protein
MRAGLSTSENKIIHDIQQSTVISRAYHFEHRFSSARPCCFRDVLLRDVPFQTQELRPTSCCPGQIAGIEMFTLGTIIHKKTDSMMSACHPATFAWCGGVVQ